MSSFEKYFNPLYKRVDNVWDFSEVKPNTNVEKEEFPYFENTEKYLIAKYNELSKRLAELEIEIEEQIQRIADETGDDKSAAVGVYNKLLKKAYLLVDRINRELDVINAPYFGKVRIRRDKLGEFSAGTNDIYIGKFAYFDEETHKLLVTDWRAPITNVYYENSGPRKEISYKTPAGIVTGDLLQKRQFEISDGRIHHIYDSKSGNVSADEFLLSQLTRRLGKKLTDIVATIQNQQNGIIRAPINKAIILQGVAGSGKTTIVLHRLAYLFYTYPEQIRAEKSLIMAPNRMFLDYISDVLPSLGIKNVESNTYIFWAKKILKWGEKYTYSQRQTDLKLKKIKGSIDFIHNISLFFEEFENSLIEDLPYSDSDVVSNKYFELKKASPDIPVLERLELAIESSFVSRELNMYMTGKSTSSTDLVKEKIKKYLKSESDIKSIYLKFIGDSKYNDKELIAYTKAGLKRNEFTQEDLAPLTWIYFKLHGNNEFMKDYIVIDEAQDMSPFEIFTLTQCAKKGNIFLAGDIAQSIVPPFHINSWEPIEKLLLEAPTVKDVEMFNINKCYRTTIEIINYANKILKKFFPKNYVLPQAVLRHGEKVSELKYQNFKQICPLIEEQFKKGAATVVIITKNEKEANEAFESLKKLQRSIDHPIFNYSDSDYRTGILVLPITKAKGLEFDSVIILNPKLYNLSDELDIREFYVASTRALHRLFMVEIDEEQT